MKVPCLLSPPLQVGNSISQELLAQCEELGVLVDKDDQGVLLQIFTKPLGEKRLRGLAVLCSGALKRSL